MVTSANDRFRLITDLRHGTHATTRDLALKSAFHRLVTNIGSDVGEGGWTANQHRKHLGDRVNSKRAGWVVGVTLGVTAMSGRDR